MAKFIIVFQWMSKSLLPFIGRRTDESIAVLKGVPTVAQDFVCSPKFSKYIQILKHSTTANDIGNSIYHGDGNNLSSSET